MNPNQPQKRGMLPGGNSLLGRIAAVSVGLIVLIIAFSIVRGIISGGSNIPELVSVAQDQQELIHIMSSAAKQPGLSVTNQNFLYTAQTTLQSTQGQLITYLAKNHKKVNPKQLNLKVSTATDKQLADAAAASTFNQTFHDISQAKLKGYQQALQQAYAHTKGPKGRQLLSDEYNGASLLLTQLNSDASAAGDNPFST